MGTKKKVLGCVLLAATALVLLVAPVGAAGKQIESVMGTGTAFVNLPGQEVRGGIRFSGSAVCNDLAFTEGARSLNGSSIDFAGQEAELAGSVIQGSITVLVPSSKGVFNPVGNQLRSASGAGSSDLACADAPLAGAVSAQVSLGPNFSKTNLDIDTATPVLLQGALNSGQEANLQGELNGVELSSDAAATVTNVDAANGIVDYSFSGQISGETSGHLKPVEAALVPALPVSGLGLLLLGLSGALAVTAVRRRQVAIPAMG